MDANTMAELTHLRERVAELERERGEILADVRVLRAEVDDWRREHRLDAKIGRTAWVNECCGCGCGAAREYTDATDSRGIMTNPLYQPPANTGEPAK